MYCGVDRMILELVHQSWSMPMLPAQKLIHNILYDDLSVSPPMPPVAFCQIQIQEGECRVVDGTLLGTDRYLICGCFLSQSILIMPLN